MPTRQAPHERPPAGARRTARRVSIRVHARTYQPTTALPIAAPDTHRPYHAAQKQRQTRHASTQGNHAVCRTVVGLAAKTTRTTTTNKQQRRVKKMCREIKYTLLLLSFYFSKTTRNSTRKLTSREPPYQSLLRSLQKNPL